LLQIKKSFSAFAQKLEMFEKGINANIRRQQESQKQADEIYQNLNRGWRRLEDEVKVLAGKILQFFRSVPVFQQQHLCSWVLSSSLQNSAKVFLILLASLGLR
jgi:hypothetical protein